MATDPIAADPAPFFPPRRRSTAVWWIAGIGFVLGLVAMFYALPLLERWRTPAAPPPQPVAAQPVQAQPAVVAPPPTLEGLDAREAVLDAQLRGLEARLASADLASRTAADNASRGEALMLAFAARRALDRGLTLGYLEPQLSARFGATEPRAVATVIAASRQPITLPGLRAALDGIAPRLTAGRIEDGVMTSLGRELANLVVLRRATTPSARPADRLMLARRALDAGDVETAVAEVERLPGAEAGVSWTVAAGRYATARRALDALEYAAISGRAATAAGAPITTTTLGIAPGG